MLNIVDNSKDLVQRYVLTNNRCLRLYSGCVTELHSVDIFRGSVGQLV